MHHASTQGARRAQFGESDAATLTLDDQGVIQECSGSCEKMFGYPQDELAGRHVSVLLPQLENIPLVLNDQANPRLTHLCRCGAAFRARRRDNKNFATELFINRLDNKKAGLRMIVRGVEDAV